MPHMHIDKSQSPRVTKYVILLLDRTIDDEIIINFFLPSILSLNLICLLLFHPPPIVTSPFLHIQPNCLPYYCHCLVNLLAALRYLIYSPVCSDAYSPTLLRSFPSVAAPPTLLTHIPCACILFLYSHRISRLHTSGTLRPSPNDFEMEVEEIVSTETGLGARLLKVINEELRPCNSTGDLILLAFVRSSLLDLLKRVDTANI